MRVLYKWQWQISLVTFNKKKTLFKKASKFATQTNSKTPSANKLEGDKLAKRHQKEFGEKKNKSSPSDVPKQNKIQYKSIILLVQKIY